MSLPPPEPSAARDPRPRPSDIAAPIDSAGQMRPSVASTRPLGGAGLIVGGATALGLLVFVFLANHRAPKPVDKLPPGMVLTQALTPPPPIPADVAAAETAARNPPLPVLAPTSATAPALPQAPAPTTPTAAPHPSPGDFALNKATLARKSPALVVDLAEPQANPAAAGAAPRNASLAQATNPAGANSLSGEEQFAQRVGASDPERSRATLLGNARNTIPQGAMIPGVLETALNSDLPGFARAVVSRDVRGFDGSTVLVPRGSRVIGQYKSALSQGQSRVFVIWTRIIRPDGATIQIGSPVSDPLGRAGLDGKVDRHFFEQFGGSILLSVLNAGVASLARAPSTEVVIGSSAQATTLGAQAIPPVGLSPTIKVAQGAAIRIFVARDLDFSSVQGATP